MKTIPGAVTIEETAFNGEERDTKGTDRGNEVEEIDQEIPPLVQTRSKDMTISEEKATMKNVDCAGKIVIGQITAVVVKLVVDLPTLGETVV